MSIITKEELKYLYIDLYHSQSEIAKMYNTTSKNINYYVRKYNLKGLKSKIKYPINENKLNVEDPILYYLAGLIATDGYISKNVNRIAIRCKNEGCEEVFQHLLNYYECASPLGYYKGSYEMRMTSEKLINQLSLLNIHQHQDKTYDLQFPEGFYNMDCLRMYLRGILDGDGNIKLRISKYTGKVSATFRLVTYSVDFINGVIQCLKDNLNLDCELSWAKGKSGTYPKLELRVKETSKFLDFVYEGYEQFRFKDKYNKYLKLKGEDIV